MIRENVFIFQNAVSATGDGNILTITKSDKVTIEITATAATFTILFEGLMPSGAYTSISGIKISDYSTRATQATAAGVWQFETTGILGLRMKISAIAETGTVTVKGITVNTSGR